MSPHSRASQICSRTFSQRPPEVSHFHRGTSISPARRRSSPSDGLRTTAGGVRTGRGHRPKDRVDEGRAATDRAHEGTNGRPTPGGCAGSRQPHAASGPSESGQARRGIARSLARAEVQPTAHGQRAGRWRVSRWAIWSDPACGRHEHITVGDDLDRKPGPVGRERPGRQVVQAHPVLQIMDRVLHLSVAPVVGRNELILVRRSGIAGRSDRGRDGAAVATDPREAAPAGQMGGLAVWSGIAQTSAISGSARNPAFPRRNRPEIAMG